MSASPIMTSFGPSIRCKVFQSRKKTFSGVKVIPLKTAYKRFSHFAYEKRIFAIRLFNPRPTWVTRQVKYWTITDMSSLCSCLFGYGTSHLFYQFEVPSTRLPYRCREDSCTNGHVTMRTFFRKEKRNTQTGLFNHISLKLINCFRSQSWIKPSFQSPLCPRIRRHKSPQRTNMIFIKFFR